MGYVRPGAACRHVEKLFQTAPMNVPGTVIRAYKGTHQSRTRRALHRGLRLRVCEAEIAK